MFRSAFGAGRRAMPHRSAVVLARRVRRLRVRAAAEDEARHAATLLSDALRTASLRGADDGRLVLIRRLPLGRISTRGGAASLALQIERVAAEVMADAVAYDIPGAATANAVEFPDRAEAIIALAGAHARGSRWHEWFWAAIVPGWRGDTPRSVRWQMLVDAAHQSAGPAAVASAVVDRAVAAGVEDELLSSITSSQAAEWLRAEGWATSARAAAAPAWRVPRGPHGQAIRRAMQAWTATDSRLLWLATMLTVVEQPAAAADPRLPGRIAFALHVHAGQTADGTTDAPPAIEQRSVAEVEGEFDSRRLSVQTSRVPPASRPGAAAPNVRALRAAKIELQRNDGVAASGVERPAAIRSAATEPVPSHSSSLKDPRPRAAPFAAAWSECGGLLFLVPVLERLEFAAFLASHPALLESAFPSRLLDEIGRRVGMMPNDPLAHACLADAADDNLSPSSRDLVADLPRPARDILTAPAPRSPLESPIELWLTAARRWCRRYPRLGLTALIRRRAHVRVTRTHVDTRFALSQIDVRVRRWALDVDPGWVPWLGRVVTFTYNDHDAS
jgi:hypothetical protein